jgi:putative spermidine/putrescine transport system permease protein
VTTADLVARPRWRERWAGRLRLRGLLPFLLLAPSGLVLLLFVASLVLLLTYSFRPYTSIVIEPVWTLDTWKHFLSSRFYWSIVWETVELALIVTGVTTMLAYPTAWVLVQIRSRALSVICYMALFSPLLVSVVVRSYGWLLLLGDHGFVNALLVRLPWIHAPVRLVFNFTGVTIALIHILLPFAVFPLLSVLRQLPPNVREAAADLGAAPWLVFLRVTLPLSLPGVVSGAQIVFTLTVSAWVTTVLLGGGRVLVLAKLVYDNISNLSWPLGAVESFVLLVIALIALALFGRLNRAIYAGREA